MNGKLSDFFFWVPGSSFRVSRKPPFLQLILFVAEYASHGGYKVIGSHKALRYSANTEGLVTSELNVGDSVGCIGKFLHFERSYEKCLSVATWK